MVFKPKCICLEFKGMFSSIIHNFIILIYLKRAIRHILFSLLLAKGYVRYSLNTLQFVVQSLNVSEHLSNALWKRVEPWLLVFLWNVFSIHAPTAVCFNVSRKFAIICGLAVLNLFSFLRKPFWHKIKCVSGDMLQVNHSCTTALRLFLDDAYLWHFILAMVSGFFIEF